MKISVKHLINHVSYRSHFEMITNMYIFIHTLYFLGSFSFMVKASGQSSPTPPPPTEAQCPPPSTAYPGELHLLPPVNRFALGVMLGGYTVRVWARA